MATGNLGAEVLELIRGSGAPSEVGNDAQNEWVAANVGEMFTERSVARLKLPAAAIWTTSM